jgi:regulator of RNase E activity RraA
VPVATQAERNEVLRLFAGRRVTDVCDGMDAAGLQDVGLMDRQIRPLWRDTEAFAPRVCGIAHTVRFVPTNKRAPVFEGAADFNRWKGQWYSALAQGPRSKEIRDGDVLVIDAAGVVDCGFIGSHNSLQWMAAGVRGAVTNGGARDTDEIIKQGFPVYCPGVSRGIRPGRLELESTNRAVTVGGVFVTPGDVVVADGDGVIVVPWEHARAVAEYAAAVQAGDSAGRRQLYEKLGLPLDFTVEPDQRD